MIAKRIGMTVAALAAAAALSACGGGGGSGGDGGTPPDPQHFQGKNDGLPNRISGAATAERATALTAMTVGVDYADGGATLADPEEISVRIFRTAPGAVPTVELTRDDDVMTFGPEHASGRRNYEVPPSGEGVQDRRGLWTWAGYPIDHADGWYVGDDGERRSQRQEYLIPLGFYLDTETVDPHRYAVIGLRTPPGGMPTHDVTASYVGEVRVDTWAVGDGGDQRRWDSEILLEADFADGTVSGTLDRWELQDFELEDGTVVDLLYEGTAYLVPETPITGNGFSGSLVAAPGCEDCVEFTSASDIVRGGFYGPYAEESGGTLQGGFTDTAGDDHVMNGIFYANR